MTDNQIEQLSEILQSATAKGFENAPPRHTSFQLPRTLAGWMSLTGLSVTFIGGISYLFVTINEIQKHSTQDMSVVVAHKFEKLETQCEAFDTHAKDTVIHQTPAVKQLATLEMIQPIRDDIKDLKSAVDALSDKIDRQSNHTHTN